MTLIHGKQFTCGCREWSFVPGTDSHDKADVRGSYKQIHSCKKLSVYQKDKSIGRIFIKQS